MTKAQAVYKPTTLQKVIRRSMAAGLGVAIGLGGITAKQKLEQNGSPQATVDTATTLVENLSYREIRENFRVHALVLDLDEYGAGQGVALANLERLQEEFYEQLQSSVPGSAVSRKELRRISQDIIESFAESLGNGGEAMALSYVYPEKTGHGHVVCAVSGAARNYTRTELLNMLSHVRLDMGPTEIDLEKFREIVVNHELAHCQNRPHAYSRLINESLADSYAALMHIQKYGDTKLPEQLMHIRTVGLLNGSGNYVTAPALAKVIEQGAAAHARGELEGLSSVQIFDMATEMAMGPENEREKNIAEYTAQAERLYSGRRFIIDNFAIDYVTGDMVDKDGKTTLFEYNSPALEFYAGYRAAITGLRGEGVPARSAEERFEDDMNEMLANLPRDEQISALRFQIFSVNNAVRAKDAAASARGDEIKPYHDVYGFTAEQRLDKIEQYVDRVLGPESQQVAAHDRDTRTL